MTLAHNRKGVPYRDSKSRDEFDKPVAGADKRKEFRGKDAQRDVSREKAQASLKAQGPNARGGAYDYRIKGRMTAGFALIAWPAKYGDTGIMTFMVNHDGQLYEKDVGPNTDAIARAISRFDPDASWQKVAP